MYPQTDGQILSKYSNYKDVVKFGNIEFPVKPTDISKFEQLNPWISVNLYMLEKKKKEGGFSVFPCHVTSSKREKHINLLFLEDRYYEEDEFVQEAPANHHYVWIKNLFRLVGSDLSKNEQRKYICDICLHYFNDQKTLDEHYEDCAKMFKCKVKLPSNKNNILKFRNYKFHERAPFVIYGDLECLLKPVSEERGYQELVSYSTAYYLQCSFDDSLSTFNIYRQRSEHKEKPAAWFVRNLLEHAKKLEKYYDNPKPMMH